MPIPTTVAASPPPKGVPSATMPGLSLSAKEREEFLRMDRERLYRISTGESESRARIHAFESSRHEDDAPSEGGWVDGSHRADDACKDEEEDDLFAPEAEPVNLPESTHTLFFTQPVRSVPFAFASSIVVISIMCLTMAFTDNLGLGLRLFQGLPEGNPFGVPANVGMSVRIAQYLGILIALLMEEEIPTGAYLLRMIPYSSFKKKFPDKSYNRFVASAMLRIALGYLFLVNVLLILIKADSVLDIFYDVLALQFIAELDDIAFSLAKLDVLGKRLRRACTARLFRTEFEKQKLSKTLKASIFLRTVYFINLAVFLGPMIHVSKRQADGYYQCNRIKVDFGDAVWEDALILWPTGDYEERTLPFSTFNGVYEKVDTEHGRPVYQERRKFDRKEYDDWKIPAQIKYNQEMSAWVFAHPLIVKKKQPEWFGGEVPRGKESDGEKPWLLRSPETKEMDLLNVDGNWQIWYGVIDTTHLTYSCTECDRAEDCNLNGQCVDKECKCNEEEDITYLGPHCEVKLKDKCRTVIAEGLNSTWSIFRYSSTPGGPPDTLFEEYNRPVYVVAGGFPVEEGDFNWLLYTGSRWIYIGRNLLELNSTYEELILATQNYHAFWNGAFTYEPDQPNFISDPTRSDNPVGVDWFQVTDWGDQFGPFGALEPLQETVGRGLFRCAGNYIPPLEIVGNAEEVGDDPNALDGDLGMNLTGAEDDLKPGDANDGMNSTEVEDGANVTENDSDFQ